MNKQQQHIAIAEACGWACEPINNRAMYYVHSLDRHIGSPVNDLNAMHEAEKIIMPPSVETWREWAIYEERLAEILDSRFIARATSEQRAEAFLRTIGKWEGGK